MKVIKANTLADFCKRFCDAPTRWGIPSLEPPYTEQEPFGVIYRGSCRREDGYADVCCDGFRVGRCLPDGYEEIEEFESSPYRFVWKNDTERAIITYCEGDVTVTVDETTAAYQQRLASAHEFYARMRA